MAHSKGGPTLQETVQFLRRLKSERRNANKAEIKEALGGWCRHGGLIMERSVFVGNGFALRLCEANTLSFSNVVLSLSALQKHDRAAVVICVVRPDRLDFRLANSTFLRRISHSSHSLRVDNIRGSFLGHDIMDSYNGVPNLPEHFGELLAIHIQCGWDENVARLVEANNAIVARATRFDGAGAELACLLAAPRRAAEAQTTERFREIEGQLSAVVERHHGELLRAASLDNVNIRGNTIERIITGEVNGHRLDDLTFSLSPQRDLIVDIKTKLLDRHSAPKAYNIDKMLRLLAQSESVFAFFFVGLDVARETVRTRLVSIFDPVIVEATRIQTHWAGRQSRGVTQLTGDITRIFAEDYRPAVDVEAAVDLLRVFIER